MKAERFFFVTDGIVDSVFDELIRFFVTVG